MSDSSLSPVSTGTAIQTAEQGIQHGLARASAAARSVADGSAAETVDLAKAAVEMLQAKTQVEASARVMHTADAMIGTLIDLRA
jgi:flagellar hook protein FlgE